MSNVGYTLRVLPPFDTPHRAGAASSGHREARHGDHARPVHPHFGTRAKGVDLTRPLDDATFARIREAFEEHSVLVFYDQRLTDEQQLAFSRRFGPLETTIRSVARTARYHPNVVDLTNLDRDDGGPADGLGRAEDALRGGQPNDRARLEQICRSLLRPPLAQDRVQLRADGRVLVELKTVWRDGPSHLLFEPIEFMENLAAIIPRPAVNLVLDHGVLAPHGAVTLCILSSNTWNLEGG
jgi:hypothetical protein